MHRMPKKKTARLLPYIQAIEKARTFGYAWEDLRTLFNDQGFDIATNQKTFRQTFMRAKAQYEQAQDELDQFPLPDEDTGSDKKTASGSGQSQSMGGRKEGPNQVDIESMGDVNSESESGTDDDENLEDFWAKAKAESTNYKKQQ